MIVNERTNEYIDYLTWTLPEYLQEVYENAVAAKVPVLRKPAQSFLKVILTEKKPENILEIGTAVGFSAMLISEYVPETAHITTLELIEERIKEAKKNFKANGKESMISLIEGDAGVSLEKLKEENRKFDFILLDAAQAQYIAYLPNLLALMNDGAILVTDNVLHNGDIIRPRFSVNRRDRTVHGRMRDYLIEISTNEHLQTSILPIGDGMSVSVFKE